MLVSFNPYLSKPLLNMYLSKYILNVLIVLASPTFSGSWQLINLFTDKFVFTKGYDLSIHRVALNRLNQCFKYANVSGSADLKQ